MHRFTPKIAVIMAACLLGMNMMAGVAVAAAPCLPSMCCCVASPMHMNHCGSMINFSLSFMKCADTCDNLMCGPLNDPLQDINALNPSPEQGYYSVFHLGMHIAEMSFVAVSIPKPKHPITIERSSSLIPLYITHLSLII